MSTDIPWLDIIRDRIGVREVAGPKANSEIMAWFRSCGHPEIADDATAWCSITVGAAVKACGLPIPARNVNMLARSWLTYGVKCTPQPGAIGVWPRGRSTWQGHVAIVEDVIDDDVVLVIGGNQGRAPGEVCRARYNISNALGFRMPIRATVEDLRAAGSTEIKKGDDLQKVGIIWTVVSCITAAINDMLHPVASSSTTLPEKLSFTQQVMEGISALGSLLGDNPWVVVVVLGGVFVYVLGARLKSARVVKAHTGVPLSVAVAEDAVVGD